MTSWLAHSRNVLRRTAVATAGTIRALEASWTPFHHTTSGHAITRGSRSGAFSSQGPGFRPRRPIQFSPANGHLVILNWFGILPFGQQGGQHPPPFPLPRARQAPPLSYWGDMIITDLRVGPGTRLYQLGHPPRPASRSTSSHSPNPVAPGSRLEARSAPHAPPRCTCASASSTRRTGGPCELPAPAPAPRAAARSLGSARAEPPSRRSPQRRAGRAPDVPGTPAGRGCVTAFSMTGVL